MNDYLKHIHGFKYIKKIPVGSGFRYFYSMDEIRAYYDKGRKQIAQFPSRRNSSHQSPMRPSIPHNKQSRSKKIFDFIKNRGRKSKGDIKTGSVDKAKEWLDKKLDKKEKEVKPDYKYIKKITIDGKSRYFYSDEEYQAYLKRKEYYANEPDFMKKFKKSKDPYTAQEDAILVNPKFDSLNSDYKYNCAECTAIYELRRRGYDVESNGVSGQPNAWAWWKRQIIEPAQSEKYNTEERYKQFYKNPKVQNVKVEPYTSDEDYAKAIEKTIKKNPPGSRGDISVQWKMGGGHSMVWEVDKKGEVHIYDTQVSGSGSRIEYKTSELAKYVAHTTYKHSDYSKERPYYTEIVRTDNLELNKGITKICKNSSSKKKGVSNNKISNPSMVNTTEKKWTDKELQTQYPILYQEERRK